jgi:hypothetical protein
MRFNKYILEDGKIVGHIDLPVDDKITRQDLSLLEKILDQLFKNLDIDIEFTKHFFDRVNDPRNKQQIQFSELHSLFTKTYVKFGQQLSKMSDGVQGVLDDIQDDINIPFVLKWNEKSKMIELVNVTVMRKKNFKTRDRIFKI